MPPPPPLPPALVPPPPAVHDADLAQASLLLSSGPEVRPNAETVHVLMNASLERLEPASAVQCFTALVAHGVAPDVRAVNLLLRALAQLGQWQQAWAVLSSAWRGVGINAESTTIVAELLQLVCVVLATTRATSCRRCTR